MVNVGLVVKLRAKDGRGNDVANFLRSALPLAEEEVKTPFWVAYRVDDVNFYVTDAFANEEDRQGHLQGPIAKALMENAPDLLAEAPEILSVDVLGAKY